MSPAIIVSASTTAPHVATNADLAAVAAITYPNGVWRDDFANGRGAPPLFYKPINSACSLNAGDGDNGSQVKSLDNKCWIAQFPPSGADIREFGALGDGSTDSTTAVQNALTAAFKPVFVPPGTFEISRALQAPSGTELNGAGASSILQATAGMTSVTKSPLGTFYAVLTNSDYSGSAKNIFVHDMKFDTSLPPKHAHTIIFYKVTTVRVHENVLAGGGVGGDGIVCVATTDCRAYANSIIAFTNAALDSWDGTTDTVFMNNKVDGGGITNYCLLFTGESTALTSNTSVRPVAIGNTLSNCVEAGIWVQGDSNGKTVGDVQDFVVAHNEIDGVTDRHGIKVSDAHRGVISGNVIRNINDIPIVIQNELFGGTQSDIVVSENVISDADTGHSGDAAILLDTGTSHVSVQGNRVVGSTQAYDVQVNSGASNNTIGINDFDVGSTGSYYIDSGTATIIDDGRIAKSGHPPTCVATGTGTGGSPGCGVEAGSSDTFGALDIKTGSTGTSTSGALTITFSAPLGITSSVCTLTAGGAGAVWNSRFTSVETVRSKTAPQMAWDNAGTALGTSTTYVLNYMCRGY